TLSRAAGGGPGHRRGTLIGRRRRHRARRPASRRGDRPRPPLELRETAAGPQLLGAMAGVPSRTAPGDPLLFDRDEVPVPPERGHRANLPSARYSLAPADVPSVAPVEGRRGRPLARRLLAWARAVRSGVAVGDAGRPPGG